MQATVGSEDDAALAMEEICRRYWYPIYAFIRRSGKSRADAEDFTQGFFERMISKDTLGHARRDRGRLRSFLLAALKRYLVDESRRVGAVKRGGGVQVLSLDYEEADERFRIEVVDEKADPDAAFRQTWANDLLAQARTQVRAVYEAAGRGEMFEALEEFLAWNESNRSYRSAAAKLGIDEKNIRSNVYRLRQRFRAALEQLILETVESPGDVQAELRELLAAAA